MFLRHLKDRGLSGVKLFITDKCLGLVEALGEFFPEAAWQRCVVHWYRNVITAVPQGRVREVVAMLKAIHAQEDRASAKQKAVLVIEKLESTRLAKAAAIVREGVVETLSYMAFPREHQRCIKTNNPLERLNREIRRRTRVVGAFPDGQSALMLVAARLRHIAGTRWGLRRYLDMNKLKDMTPGDGSDDGRGGIAAKRSLWEFPLIGSKSWILLLTGSDLLPPYKATVGIPTCVFSWAKTQTMARTSNTRGMQEPGVREGVSSFPKCPGSIGGASGMAGQDSATGQFESVRDSLD